MKPRTELLYNLAALALVGAFAYFSFWEFLLVVGPCVLITLSLMTMEAYLR